MVDDIRPPFETKRNQTEEPYKNPPVEKYEQKLPANQSSNLYRREEGFIELAQEPLEPRFKFHIPHIWFRDASKKERVVGGIVAAVLLIAGGGIVYSIQKHFSKSEPQAPAVVQVKKQPPPPTTEPSRLTGVQIPIELNKRPVFSVQIENSPDARPQSGLLEAGVVYEAIAEGGITRFNASYLEAQPNYIGPIRSVRPYYAALAAPFDPVLVRAGGSGDGIAKVRELALKDLDHGSNGGAFHRAGDRFAPHNLYTSMGELDRASAIRKHPPSVVKSFPRKKEKRAPQITAKAIDLAISRPLYNVHYDYEPASNSYMRTLGGRPHTDHRSGKQLAPKVVIALVMKWSQNGIYSVYQTTGSGDMLVFQDGTVQKGVWHKAGDKEQFKFVDAAGKPLALNPGQTWISLIRSPDAAKYVP